jgi:hypothetical protein
MNVNAIINDAATRAHRSLEREGFFIKNETRVVVDPNLQVMGYTYFRDGFHYIVLSGFTVTSDLLDGLLVHEMSHIFRSEVGHPSHDEDLINEILTCYRSGDYREGVLLEIINHVKDVYADDVAFRVFRRWSGGFSGKAIRDFFLDWIKTEPMYIDDTEKAMWLNGSILVSNAFAIGSMMRHGYREFLSEGFNAKNNSFLGKIDVDLVENFEYFKESFARGFEQTIDTPLFRRRLSEYLDCFISMVEGG